MSSDAPLFWLRLAAFTHAGVLSQALHRLPNPEGFLRWAVDSSGPTFFWHGMLDRRDAPRWRPEWISPDHVYAQLVGRARDVVVGLGKDDCPQRWAEGIGSAFDKLVQERHVLAAFFPGPFEDFHDRQTPADLPYLEQITASLRTAKRLAEVPALLSVVYANAPQWELVDEVIRIVGSAPDQPLSDNQNEDVRALSLCAHIAATGRSEPLAKAVIGRCTFLIRAKRPYPITDVFAIVVEACAAHSDPKSHRQLLDESACQIAFLVDDKNSISELLAVIEVLGEHDPTFIAGLSRASAILRAGLRAA